MILFFLILLGLIAALCRILYFTVMYVSESRDLYNAFVYGKSTELYYIKALISLQERFPVTTMVTKLLDKIKESYQ